VLIVVLVLLVGLGTSGTASARAAQSGPRIGAWHRVATRVAQSITTDGTRYAATRLTGNRLRIDDTATGRRRILTWPSCRNAQGIASGKPDFLLGSGLVMWQCPDRFINSRQIWIDDIRTGARTQPRGLTALWASERNSSDGATFTVVGVGRHWLYAIRTGYHYSDDILVGVHTPRVIHSPAERADVAAAPDTTAGIVRLCAGIRRTPDKLGGIGGLAFSPLQYDEPYAVSTSGHLRACHGAPAPPAGHPVVQLGGGLITWSRTTRVYAQSVATGRRTSRRAPGRVISVTHTRHEIFITTASDRSYRAHTRV
jgi:hypothetical protein